MRHIATALHEVRTYAGHTDTLTFLIAAMASTASSTLISSSSPSSELSLVTMLHSWWCLEWRNECSGTQQNCRLSIIVNYRLNTIIMQWRMVWRTCQNTDMERDGGTRSPTGPQTLGTGDPSPTIGHVRTIGRHLSALLVRGRLKGPCLHCRATAVAKHLPPLSPTT